MVWGGGGVVTLNQLSDNVQNYFVFNFFMCLYSFSSSFVFFL